MLYLAAVGDFQQKYIEGSYFGALIYLQKIYREATQKNSKKRRLEYGSSSMEEARCGSNS